MTPSMNTLHKYEHALELAQNMMKQLADKAINLNDFNREISFLWESYQDLTEIKDVCSDPWTNKDLVEGKLTEIRQQITDLNTGKKP